MRLFRLTIVFCSAIILSVAHGGTLEEGFRRPPDTARLWVYWTQSGHDSLESATADLEAIKKAGIGGVLRMDCSVGQVPGGSAFLSEPWRELFVHSVYECERLGLEFGVCVCFPGAVSVSQVLFPAALAVAEDAAQVKAVFADPPRQYSTGPL